MLQYCTMGLVVSLAKGGLRYGTLTELRELTPIRSLSQCTKCNCTECDSQPIQEQCAISIK